jgi:SAM-dependent MidA family methyltransferase
LSAHGDNIRWLDRLPDQPFEGVILANEVVDALPVSCFIKRADAAFPLGVQLVDGDFAWAEGDLDPRLSEAVELLEASLGRTLPEGFRSEIRLGLSAWIQTLSAVVARGAMLIVDYGLVRREYYHADRNQGTLLCHYKHLAHTNPFLYPGLQDIGAWVDFSAVADAAVGAGAEVSGFTTQTQFLLESKALRQLSMPSSGQLQGLKTLVLPGEMGERFKLILLSKGLREAGLVGRDFRDRL